MFQTYDKPHLGMRFYCCIKPSSSWERLWSLCWTKSAKSWPRPLWQTGDIVLKTILCAQLMSINVHNISFNLWDQDWMSTCNLNVASESSAVLFETHNWLHSNMPTKKHGSLQPFQFVACPNSSSRFQGYQNPKIGTSRFDTPSSLKVFPIEQKIFDDFKQIMSSKLGII